MIPNLSYFGYAPGNYRCECSVCGSCFSGEKRAWRCEKCAKDLQKIYKPPAPEIPVIFAPTHVHVKSGKPYTLLMAGLMESTLEVQAIYRDADGKVWVRPLGEFQDEARFRSLDNGRD